MGFLIVQDVLRWRLTLDYTDIYCQHSVKWHTCSCI